MPQDKQRENILLKEAYDLGKTVVVVVARGVIWWKPGTPFTCKLVNRGNEPAEVSNFTPIAHMIALSSRNAHHPCSTDPRRRRTHAYLNPQAPATAKAPPECQVKGAILDQLGPNEKRQLMDTLQKYITAGSFPSDPKRVPACIGSELMLPLKMGHIHR